MKNLLTVAMATLFLIIVSCSSEENDYTIDQAESVDLASDVYQESNIGIYNGIFTTLDGEQRGSVEVIIPVDNSRNASAVLSLASGEIISLLTNDLIQKGLPIENITFGSDTTGLTFSVNADGKNPKVTAVSLNNIEGSIRVRKHTARAPVVPIPGSYICTDCGTHPILNNSTTQTFNLLMFNAPDGDSSFDTQVTLGMNTYDGAGTQSSCTTEGAETSCDISGSFTVNGGPVTWSGSHLFNNEATGMQDCSGASGIWSFESANFGTITGTFLSDEDCNDPSGGLFISEIADPNNNAGSGRFIEITNGSTTSFDASGWEVRLYSNTNTEPNATFPFPEGTMIASGDSFVISQATPATFATVYNGIVSDGRNGSFSANGDDSYAIADPNGALVDVYGTIGTDETGSCAEYEDGRALRVPGTTEGSPIFNESQWIIRADSSITGCTDHANDPQDAPDDFNPGTY